MSFPKVSVLIPCYNAEKYIGETLDSVFAQTWPNLEVIVVDDGSTDDSMRVVRSYERPGLKIICQENRGQTAALNACLAAATGDYIQYLDADDLIGADKIEIQMSRLTTSPGCVATAEWGRFYHSPDETDFAPREVWKDLAPLDWLAEGMEMMFPALWLIPADLARSVGPWLEDLSLNNDAEYFTRIILASRRVLFCKGARCYYRSGLVGSLSRRRSADAWRSQFRVVDLCEQRIRAAEDSERMRRVFAIMWQHLAHACYPYEPKIASEALDRAKSLHSIKIRPDGGFRFRVLSRVLGWRVARRLQVTSGRP